MKGSLTYSVGDSGALICRTGDQRSLENAPGSCASTDLSCVSDVWRGRTRQWMCNRCVGNRKFESMVFATLQPETGRLQVLHASWASQDAMFHMIFFVVSFTDRPSGAPGTSESGQDRSLWQIFWKLAKMYAPTMGDPCLCQAWWRHHLISTTGRQS